jgi:hypothetical protein
MADESSDVQSDEEAQVRWHASACFGRPPASRGAHLAAGVQDVRATAGLLQHLQRENKELGRNFDEVGPPCRQGPAMRGCIARAWAFDGADSCSQSSEASG